MAEQQRELKGGGGVAVPGGQRSPREILRERARKLARSEAAMEEAAPDGLDVLEFVLGGDRYALPVPVIREVCPARDLSPLPGTPDFVLGVIVIRGQLVSVLDLGLLLGLSPSEVIRESRAIVLQRETMTFALLADHTGGVEALPEEELRPGVSAVERLNHRYIRGVTRDRLIVLDGEKLLSDPDLVVNG